MFKKPSEQQAIFFKWCTQMGVHRFDIQIRVPRKTPHRNSPWMWFSPIKNISTDYYFLKLSAWCRYINLFGGDIFIRPCADHEQPLLFLDDLPIKKAIALSQKYASCVICTSTNNTQVWLAIDTALSKSDRMRAQAYLRDLGYTDPGSISGDHLGRLCGVKSRKRNCWVNLLATTDTSKYTPILKKEFSFPHGGTCVSNKISNKSISEQDFGWMIGLLKLGFSQSESYVKLLSNSIDRKKPNPEQYALRTVRKAASLL